MSAPANAKLYGLIGHPVSHSLSPYIMNRAFRQNGIEAVYATFDVGDGGVVGAVAGMRALGFGGANVTYPYKEAVLQLPDSLPAEVELIGALNTLRFTDSGIEGANTDAPGTAAALETFAGATLDGADVLIFGAGGAGRAAAFGLLERSAARLTFAVRNESKGKDVVERFRRHFPDQEVGLVAMKPGETTAVLGKAIESAGIVINATPVGMAGGGAGELLAEDSPLDKNTVCFEFVYDPLETSFLELARRRGARTLDGLTLLVAQAERAMHVWTGKGFSLPKMYEAVTLHVRDTR